MCWYVYGIFIDYVIVQATSTRKKFVEQYFGEPRIKKAKFPRTAVALVIVIAQLAFRKTPLCKQFLFDNHLCLLEVGLNFLGILWGSFAVIINC